MPPIQIELPDEILLSLEEITEGLAHIIRPGEDRLGRDGSRVATGQTRAGRYFHSVFVITAV
jgi:hypothetical protein